MAEVVSTRDLPQSGQEGWVREYEIRRADGEMVTVVVDCSEPEGPAGPLDPEIGEILADQGLAWALQKAEEAQRGREARVRIDCRGLAGVWVDFQYAHPRER